MWLAYFEQYLSRQFPAFLAEKPWNYKDDLCIIGAEDLRRTTGDEKWAAPILAAAPWLVGKDGQVTGLVPGEHNIDKVSFGKSLRILRDLTGEAVYAQGVERAWEVLQDYPRTPEGNFWHKDIYPQQVWLDGLYMGQPFYAACLAERGEDRWDDVLDQFATAHALLWDGDRKLYLHANDRSGQMDWADPMTGRSPAVWLRAEGWFLMALCDVFEIARDHTRRASELIPMLQNALDGLLAYQDRATGMFLQVVDRPDLAGNYPETSGSAMAAYACMKGARLDMLPEGYAHTGEAILEGIRKTYLRQEAGTWHLRGICASAGLGPGPDHRTDRTGTPAYYLSEKQMTDNQHGAGAAMMALSELLLLKGPAYLA